jgi:hypothetical protein
MIETLEQRLARARQEMYRAPTSSWVPRAPAAPAAATLPGPSESPSPTPVRSRQGGKLIAVGDSLGVGTTPYLKTAGSDTVVGRSSASAVQALRKLVGQGGVGNVLFDAGTNDASAGQLAQSLRRASKIAGGAQIYVPTVNGPDAAAKNKVIRDFANQGLIQMVDWAGASRGLVGSDGIHASPQGYKRRAQLIRQAMR